MKNLPTLILASQSPRRAELLQRLALPFEARPADIDEETLGHLEPAQMALELATQKAQAVWQPGQWVLAADTVVALEGEPLGKPETFRKIGSSCSAFRAAPIRFTQAFPS